MSNKTHKETLREKAVSEFARYENSLNGEKNSTLHHYRRQAIAFIEAAGFPGKKHEEWRYANLSFLNKYNFRLQIKPPELASNTELPEDVFAKIPNITDSIRLVFVNGYYARKYSDVPEISGMGFSTMYDSIHNGTATTDEIINLFSDRNDYKDNPFLALNNSLAMDGAVIIIASNAVIEKPIHLIYINDSRIEPMLAQQRNYVLFGENSQANIIESYHTIGSNAGFINIATDIFLGGNAVVNTHKLQSDNELSHIVCSTDVVQQAGSVFNDFAVTLSGGFVRNNLSSTFEGQNAEANLNSLYFINDNNYIDNHTLIDHAVPNCNSNELYKGIIGGGATATFSGKILVRKDAQKTTAYQSNKNILLTDKATINTKPQLEIYADDVKCSHGAASGSIDPDELFYLRARGIGEEKARAMLLGGFAGEVISKIKIEQLRKTVEDEVSARLEL